MLMTLIKLALCFQFLSIFSRLFIKTLFNLEFDDRSSCKSILNYVPVFFLILFVIDIFVLFLYLIFCY